MRLILILSFVVLAASCKKKATEDANPVVQPTSPVSGTIQLPAGVALNTNGWTVNAGLSDTIVKENKYQLSSASKNFDIAFLADQNGTDKMMGIFYEGQTDFTINSTSTVLSMLMKMPAVNSLTTAGKLKLLNAIKANPGFSEVVADFEQRFLQNIPLFDQSDTVFRNKLSTLFQKVAARTMGAFKNIDMIRVGKKVSIQNPGWAFSQTIGFYKNGNRINMQTLDRYQWFAGSLNELLALYGNPPNPIKLEYDLEGDGTYVFKVRTGKPFVGVSDLESEFAFAENYTNAVMDQVGFFVKHCPFINFNNDCVKNMRSFASSQVTGYMSLLSQTNNNSVGIQAIFYQIPLTTIDMVINSTECFTTIDEKTYLGKAKQFMRFVGWISDVGYALNSTAFLTMYPLAPAAFDTCLTVSGNNVVTCEPYVTIGSQKWMQKNLDVVTYANGDPIPEVKDPILWSKLTTGAWCYYNNDPTTNSKYGKIYNWYAVTDPRGLAPAGWHIPTNSEWRTLESFLGGIQVAGGKLKATTFWQSPNEGATNSSGFTALPGGCRNDVYNFHDESYSGYWWSSTSSDVDKGYIQRLQHDAPFMWWYPDFKRYGASVRCLMN